MKHLRFFERFAFYYVFLISFLGSMATFFISIILNYPINHFSPYLLFGLAFAFLIVGRIHKGFSVFAILLGSLNLIDLTYNFEVLFVFNSFTYHYNFHSTFFSPFNIENQLLYFWVIALMWLLLIFISVLRISNSKVFIARFKASKISS